MLMTSRNILIAGLFLVILGGCSSFWQLGNGAGARGGVSSSLVDYLYPKGEVPPDIDSTIPRLELPLRVGIAFVPAVQRSSAISEATKMQLLENVKQEFVDREYIEHIEVVPDTYLRSSNGIRGMQQVARLYGVDVIALVSYDQVAVSEDNTASFLYWTIVGAYVVKGTENEVQTFVDTAVFDVNTARLLFRAPGADKSSKRSTAVQSRETVRKSSEASFVVAMRTMTDNLALELDRFQERAMEDAQVADVEWKQGFGGGGALGLWFALTLLLAGAVPGARRVFARPVGRAPTGL
jgi:rhombotail lipoprotein